MTTNQTRKFIVETLSTQYHRYKLTPRPGIDMPLTEDLASALRIAAGAGRIILSIADVVPPRHPGERWIFQVLTEDDTHEQRLESLYVDDALRSYPKAPNPNNLIVDHVVPTEAWPRR